MFVLLKYVEVAEETLNEKVIPFKIAEEQSLIEFWC